MKHFLGIDVAKQQLDVCLIDHDGQCVGLERAFANTADGIAQLLQQLPEPRDTCVLYESTGVYGKKLAAYLTGRIGMLCEVNPKIIKNAATTATQTKTDRVDARAIAHVARHLWLSRPDRLKNTQIDGNRDENLALWIAEYDRMRKAISQLKCQIDTVGQHPAEAARQIVERLRRELDQLKASQRQVKQQIEQMTQTLENVQRIASVKGIGTLTAAALNNRIGNIQRFADADKLKAYLGIYPAQRQSGTRKIYTRMARHGDRLIRHLLWNCAKSAARHNPACRQLFERLVQHGNSMLYAWAAVMRKLVQIVYGVLKTNSMWNPDIGLTSNG